MIQAAILILSGLAFWMSTAVKPHRGGYIIGMLAQPLWIYDTWQHGQWGMFLLSLCFFFGYARGWWRQTYWATKHTAERLLAENRSIEAIALLSHVGGKRFVDRFLESR